MMRSCAGGMALLIRHVAWAFAGAVVTALALQCFAGGGGISRRQLTSAPQGAMSMLQS